jgi:hypothetical protein
MKEREKKISTRCKVKAFYGSNKPKREMSEWIHRNKAISAIHLSTLARTLFSRQDDESARSGRISHSTPRCVGPAVAEIDQSSSWLAPSASPRATRGNRSIPNPTRFVHSTVLVFIVKRAPVTATNYRRAVGRFLMSGRQVKLYMRASWYRTTYTVYMKLR